jgi:hypothetical protein
MKTLEELSKKLDKELENQELEKRKMILIQKGKDDAELDSLEKNVSKFTTYAAGFIGFLNGCSIFKKSGVDSDGIFNGYHASFYEIFICPILYPAIGALIGWILVKLIFWVIRSSRNKTHNYL